MIILSGGGGGGSISDKYNTPAIDGIRSSGTWVTVTNITAGEGFVDSVIVYGEHPAALNYLRGDQYVKITIDGGAPFTLIPAMYHYNQAGFYLILQNISYKKSLKVEYLSAGSTITLRGVCCVNRRY